MDKRNNQDKTSTYCTLRLVGQSSSSFRLKQKARSNQIHNGQNRWIGQTDTLTHHIVPKETKNNTIDRHRLSGSKRLLYILVDIGRCWAGLESLLCPHPSSFNQKDVRIMLWGDGRLQGRCYGLFNRAVDNALRDDDDAKARSNQNVRSFVVFFLLGHQARIIPPLFIP